MMPNPNGEFVKGEELKLFVWSVVDCYPNEFIALARSELEARFIIHEQLGFYPKSLDKKPTRYDSPVAFSFMGDE